MAANCARRALLSCSSSSLNSISRQSSSSTFASVAAKLETGFSSAKPTSSRFSRRAFSSRVPVELGCAQSLMPLHSVTASALLTSKLSLKAVNWGWLSEGFATTL